MSNTVANPGLSPRFAGVQGLGPLISYHPINRNDRIGNVFLALICFASAAMMWNLSVERVNLARVTDSPYLINDDPLYLYWPAAAAALALLAGLWLLISMARNWRTAAALYEGGVALRDPAGLRQFSWGEVEQVLQSVTRYYRNGALSNTVYVFSVRTRDGRTFRLGSRLAQIKELGEALQRNVSAALLPRYARALSGGHRLEFGPLALDRQGLHAGRRSLAWAEIAALRIANGSLIVMTAAGPARGWKPVKLAQLPNLLVFYQIVGGLTTIV